MQHLLFFKLNLWKIRYVTAKPAGHAGMEGYKNFNSVYRFHTAYWAWLTLEVISMLIGQISRSWGLITLRHKMRRNWWTNVFYWLKWLVVSFWFLLLMAYSSWALSCPPDHHWSPVLLNSCLLPRRREADIQWLQIRFSLHVKTIYKKYILLIELNDWYVVGWHLLQNANAYKMKQWKSQRSPSRYVLSLYVSLLAYRTKCECRKSSNYVLYTFSHDTRNLRYHFLVKGQEVRSQSLGLNEADCTLHVL